MAEVSETDGLELLQSANSSVVDHRSKTPILGTLSRLQSSFVAVGRRCVAEQDLAIVCCLCDERLDFVHASRESFDSSVFASICGVLKSLLGLG